MVNLLQDKINQVTSSTFVSLYNTRVYGLVSECDLWDKGYVCNPIVYSVINGISNKCASLPLNFMDGDQFANENDSYKFLFEEKWNESYGKEEGLRLAITNLLTFGVCYIEKVGDGLIPDELHVLPNQYVTPEQKTISFYDLPSYYTFQDSGKRYTIPREKLIIVRLPYNLVSKNKNDGLSPLQACWDIVLASNNRSEAEKSLFENRGAAGIISPKSNKDGRGMTQNAFDWLQDKLKGLIGGADKAGKIIQANEAVDFTQIGMTSNDLQLIQSDVQHVRKIAGVYNYPSQLLGDTEASQYDNYESALKSVYVDVVIPYMKLFINQFEMQFLNEVNGMTGRNYYIEIDKSRIEALNQSWVQQINGLPQGLQTKIIEKLNDSDIENIINEIGVRND